MSKPTFDRGDKVFVIVRDNGMPDVIPATVNESFPDQWWTGGIAIPWLWTPCSPAMAAMMFRLGTGERP